MNNTDINGIGISKIKESSLEPELITDGDRIRDFAINCTTAKVVPLTQDQIYLQRIRASALHEVLDMVSNLDSTQITALKAVDFLYNILVTSRATLTEEDFNKLTENNTKELTPLEVFNINLKLKIKEIKNIGVSINTIEDYLDKYLMSERLEVLSEEERKNSANDLMKYSSDSIIAIGMSGFYYGFVNNSINDLSNEDSLDEPNSKKIYISETEYEMALLSGFFPMKHKIYRLDKDGIKFNFAEIDEETGEVFLNFYYDENSENAKIPYDKLTKEVKSAIDNGFKLSLDELFQLYHSMEISSSENKEDSQKLYDVIVTRMLLDHITQLVKEKEEMAR